MNKDELIECIISMLEKMDSDSVERIFYYVHNKYIKRTEI